ncbi:Xaa-Pro peptidase family protein [Phyllobacterium sp. 0TCS1.6C]|uniref:M24 family metallopeptidase n=1 Tax=unclassified Phyllobacterium TaxID=2638441 RepID=UPI0022646DDF|nr:MULTISPECIES: Xaa-Pro peptidase family protein [unclassified Phyllobacterium]MCX8279024.1 Xaa-Pro peptidase family protein [Phyllobacterium sp. 0TCS1.6C]MCX8293808.1 Xaa-Pro peptidase family protein [Phyllobacterium sp. 0TCS1.6A]
MDERLARTIEAIKASGADWGLFTSPDGIAYASGHIVSIETGPSPFAGGPAIALVGKHGECGLVVTNLEAETPSWADMILTYEGFSYKEPTDIFANYCNATQEHCTRLGVGGTIGIEQNSFPMSLLPLVSTQRHVSLDDAFKRQRMVKTATEITLLREAALTASAGQRALIEHGKPGRSELEIFADVRLAMETSAGERLPLAGDFISGKERTSAFMGWPTNRVIATGDPLICDLAPRVKGYWGDSCASVMLGKASVGFEKQFNAVKSALDLAIEIVRPGLGIGELDQKLQAHIAAQGYGYAHHSGHSIGTSVHEWPRLVSYETERFKKDMVVMVEPTSFDPDIGGVRLEFMLHVTEIGCEVLADFEHRMSI